MLQRFTSGVRGRPALDEYRVQPAAMLFPETNEESQPDLEKPTFLRSLLVVGGFTIEM